ncbi:MAG: cytidylate kinase-like family protein [Lachnospiraceae bacterium]|nr:cytidylate kinase-like family protein [Lachnospiraceae bacterium]
MGRLVITIARSYGSGGRTMGKLLAESLGMKYYDRELMKIASEKSGINEALFGQADEKLKNSSLLRIMKKAYKGEKISPDSDDYVSNDNLFHLQSEVIKELAEEEDCVIIGRCADYVLKDNPNVIRLFCYAPLQDCIERERKLSGLEDKEIIKKINKIDKHRAEYYKYYTGKEWNDARNYDLCLNTTSMSYEELIQVVKAYIQVHKKEN